ncbi:MAG: isoprenylcysteine carboxylmethyltransferase family protein [Verrucomicrobiae bacterium]|nr:isoprenylcysteine carboxylmethyltransferase family protein [Verrucomicrobiae bacterium]
MRTGTEERFAVRIRIWSTRLRSAKGDVIAVPKRKFTMMPVPNDLPNQPAAAGIQTIVRERWLEVFRIDYHNGWLVALYILLGTVFLIGVLHPRTRKQWRAAGMAQAWVIALYAEMYGTPLTMYALATATGQIEFAQRHFYGHAWAYLFGWGDTGAIVLTVLGQLMIGCGATLALVGWRQIYRGRGQLVTTGLYRRIRHPQYAGFFLFLLGSMINWPTLPTLLMLPVLLVVYYRLARAEETDALAQFGEAYRLYQRTTGMFLPRVFAR